MMRLSRARWLERIAAADESGWQWPKAIFGLRRWLWEHGFVEDCGPGRARITALGREALAKANQEHDRHGRPGLGRVLPPNLIPVLIRQVEEFFAVQLTPEHVAAVVRFNRHLLEQFARFGVDTVTRDAFMDEFARYMCVDGGWPTNGDTDDYAKKFFGDLRRSCEKKGVQILNSAR